MKVVSLIPARKGSKGIKNKNLINLCGKPLIQYSIQASLKSKVNETYVSSDCSKILNISKKIGAKTIKRPIKFSTDTASSESVLLHFAEKVDFDILVFIQCTAPLIKSEDINEGIKKMKKYDSVLSVSETNQMFWNNKSPLYNLHNRLRRQKSKKRYIETGSFFITTKKNLIKYKNRISGYIGFVEIPKHRSFDIDDLGDLKLVEAIIKYEKHFND
jgi:CMP-N,N'-diacetyllegionaminic acid synthase